MAKSQAGHARPFMLCLTLRVQHLFWFRLSITFQTVQPTLNQQQPKIYHQIASIWVHFWRSLFLFFLCFFQFSRWSVVNTRLDWNCHHLDSPRYVEIQVNLFVSPLQLWISQKWCPLLPPDRVSNIFAFSRITG